MLDGSEKMGERKVCLLCDLRERISASSCAPMLLSSETDGTDSVDEVAIINALSACPP
jgi:hypothetical protein